MSMMDGIAALSGQFGGVLQRRLRETGGIALLALAMMAALALATWSVQDPSLSHATDTPVRNLLGSPGAIAADLMMQLFGLGSLALLLPVAVWGYRLLGHRALSRERLRVMLWLGGAVLAAAFASCLPRTAHWPLPSGLGGVIGDAMLRLPDEMFHAPLIGANRFAAAMILGAAALFAFAGAAGLLWSDAIEDEDYEEPEEEADDEEEESDGGWISLGFIAHHLLSLRTQLMLLLRFRQRPAVVTRSEGAMSRRRVEPRFDQGAERAPLVPDDDDDEESDAIEAAPRAARKPQSAEAAPLQRRFCAATSRTSHAAKQSRSRHRQRGHITDQLDCARRRARRFRRARRNHQCAAWSGGDSL